MSITSVVDKIKQAIDEELSELDFGDSIAVVDELLSYLDSVYASLEEEEESDGVEL